MRPYKRFREVLEDAAGKRIPLATVNVANTDGSLATLYADINGTGGSIGSQVQSSVTGEVSFYADDGQYTLSITKTGYVGSVVENVSVGGGGLGADDGIMVDPRKAPYNIVPNMGEAGGVALQQCVNDHVAKYGTGSFTIRLPGFTIQTSKGLVVPDTCNFEGNDPALSRIQVVKVSDPSNPAYDHFDGRAIVLCRATAGRGGGRLKHQHRNYRLDGGNVDRYGGDGTATAGSDVLTNFQAVRNGTNFTVPTGGTNTWIVEFIGSDDICVIKQYLSANSVQISKPALFSNSPQTRVVLREGYTVTASSVAGSNVFNCTSVTGLRVGMRVAGDGVGVDEEDERPGLSSWTRITAINGLQVTTDEPAKNSTSSFAFTAWAEYFGMEFQHPKFAIGGYNSSLDYRGADIHGVEVRQLPGMCFFIKGTAQTHFSASKGDYTDRGAIYVVGSSDCWAWRSGGGTTWDTCITYASSATPRVSGEGYLPYRTDVGFCIAYRNMREATVIDCDINGPMYFSRVSSETKPILTLMVSNLKWFTANKAPDPAILQSYFTVKGLHLNVIGGGQKWSQTLGSRPKHLVTGSANGSASFWCQQMVLDPQDERCPFGVETAPGSGIYEGSPAGPGVKVAFLGVDEDGDITMGDGTFEPTVSCVTNPESLVVSYADRRGHWSRLPGGRVCITMQITATITSIGTSPVAGGSLRLSLPPGISPRSGFGGQRLAASVEGPGVILGTDFIVNSLKVAEGGAVSVWKTGPSKTPVEAALGNFPVGAEFTISVFGELLV